MRRQGDPAPDPTPDPTPDPVPGAAGPAPGEAGRDTAWGPRRRLGAVLGTLGAGVVAWGAALATNRALRAVDGPSMLPTLAPDDHLLTLTPSLRTPRRGDVVVLAAGSLAPAASVKRLVGLPGDRVVVLDGHLFVDDSWWELSGGVLVDEDHVVFAGPDEVVVLGDNRAASTDSRVLGPVPSDAVQRVAVARIRPFARLGGGLRRVDGPRRRDAVRVVVLDPDERALLFRVADVDGVLADWWETPGGGLLPGEDHARAAVREVAEEVGAADVSVHDLDHVATRDSVLHGAPLHRVEATWAARVPDATVSTAGWTPAEQVDHRDWQWFTRDELLALEAVTHPVELVAVYDLAVARLRAVERAEDAADGVATDGPADETA